MNSVAECSSTCWRGDLKIIEKAILLKTSWILSVIEKDMHYVQICILTLTLVDICIHAHKYAYGLG